MEPHVKICFEKILNKTGFYRKEATSDANSVEEKQQQKSKSVKKGKNGTSCIKKPNNQCITTTKKNYSDYRHNSEVNKTAVNNVSGGNLKNIASICSDSNSDYECNNDDKRTDVRDLSYPKELTSFYEWFANCVTEENCILPEDLALYVLVDSFLKS